MIRRVLHAICVLAMASAASAATLPPWARDVVASPAAAGTADAVVLIDHVDVVIGSDGRIRTTRRYAALIRDRAGRDAAMLREVYVSGSGSVKNVRAWLVKGGAVREIDQRRVVDVALVNNDVYNEVRARGLSAGDEVAAGETFVAELESEERLLFSQFEWQMQHQWPARLVRRTITLPAGWHAKSVVFNGPALDPRPNGSVLAWERRDLAALPDEPAMPPPSDVAERLAVSVFASGTARAPGQFESWQAVAQWLGGLSDAASVVTAPVATKARSLTERAANDFERAAAIGAHAQRVQYISIQTGVGRGGGYQPRAAALVLERNYGDCKDKASLMRAMLSAVGINSYLVSVYSGDRNYVRGDWPSPQQFNHAILAVALRVPPDRQAPVIDHLQLGSLVLFDPTDEHTPFGELPLDEQGSLALIVHPKSDGLVRLPLLPAQGHATDRTVTGAIDANGMLTAAVRERYTGAPAATARALRAGLDAAAYREVLTRRIAASIPRVRIANLATPIGASDREAEMTLEVEARDYGHASGGLLLVAMPFDRAAVAQMPASVDRQTPVLLEPGVVTDTVQLQLPAGLVVDEAQRPVRIESPFGRYSLEFTTANGSLQAKRRLEIPLQRIEAAQLPAARAFFDRVRSADTSVVVLARKPQ